MNLVGRLQFGLTSHYTTVKANTPQKLSNQLKKMDDEGHYIRQVIPAAYDSFPTGGSWSNTVTPTITQYVVVSDKFTN